MTEKGFCRQKMNKQLTPEQMNLTPFSGSCLSGKWGYLQRFHFARLSGVLSESLRCPQMHVWIIPLSSLFAPLHRFQCPQLLPLCWDPRWRKGLVGILGWCFPLISWDRPIRRKLVFYVPICVRVWGGIPSFLWAGKISKSLTPLPIFFEVPGVKHWTSYIPGSSFSLLNPIPD